MLPLKLLSMDYHLLVLVATHHRILHSNGLHLPIYPLPFCLQNQHSNGLHLPIHSWPSSRLIWDNIYLSICCERSCLLLLDNNRIHSFYHKSIHFLPFFHQNQHNTGHHLPIHFWPSYHLILDSNYLPICCERSFLLLLDNNRIHSFCHKSTQL